MAISFLCRAATVTSCQKYCNGPCIFAAPSLFPTITSKSLKNSRSPQEESARNVLRTEGKRKVGLLKQSARLSTMEEAAGNFNLDECKCR